MIFPPRCGGHCAVFRARREASWFHVTSFGGYSEGETPLPIPNREVKPLSADGTWLERAWESRSPPAFGVNGPPFGAARSELCSRVGCARGVAASREGF